MRQRELKIVKTGGEYSCEGCWFRCSERACPRNVDMNPICRLIDPQDRHNYIFVLRPVDRGGVKMTKQKPRKLMTACPFCNSPQTMDKLHTRFYACGTTADRDRGQYDRRCK